MMRSGTLFVCVADLLVYYFQAARACAGVEKATNTIQSVVTTHSTG